MSAQPVMDQAIAWAVTLESGTAGTEVHAACEAWRAADPAHEHAWRQVEAVEQAFRAVPQASGRFAYRTLQAVEQDRGVRASRRRALRLLGLGAIGMGAGLLALNLVPWQVREVFATALGERRRVALADGTQLRLNTASAADVLFSPLRRLIALRQGEIAVDTGRDPGSLTGRRPFWVETAHARFEAIGTRFGVRQEAQQTLLNVTEGAVAIHVPGSHAILARAGETYLVKASGGLPIRLVGLTFDPSAWAEGVLVAKQMRLDAFVAELSRYRSVPVLCDPDAAELRVSGVFQLEGVDPSGSALEALARTLPIRILRGPDGAVTVIHA